MTVKEKFECFYFYPIAAKFFAQCLSA